MVVTNRMLHFSIFFLSFQGSPVVLENDDLTTIREEGTYSPELPPPAECDQLSSEVITILYYRLEHGR